MPTEPKVHTAEHERRHHANLCSIADRTRPLANLLREALEDVRELNEKVSKIETATNSVTSESKAPLAEAKSAGSKVTQKIEICLKNANEIDALTDHLPENPNDPNSKPKEKVEANVNKDGSFRYATESKRATKEWQTKYNDDGSLKDAKEAEKAAKDWDAAHPVDGTKKAK